jgi:hypothetical protein
MQKFAKSGGRAKIEVFVYYGISAVSASWFLGGGGGWTPLAEFKIS